MRPQSKNNGKKEFFLFFFFKGYTNDTENTIGSMYYMSVNNLDIESDNTDYVTIQFVNSSSYQFEFTGGIINISRCNTGCD